MFPIHLITLEETPERERKALHELSKYPFQVIPHRFRRHKVGWKGCIDSHLKVFQQGTEDKCEILWIAEDNLSSAFDTFPVEKYRNLFKFLKKNKTWGIVFVGGYILRPLDYCQETLYPQVYETRNNNHGTVSYIIHERLYSKILEYHKRKPINVHYDIFLSQAKCYIYNPLLFYHAHDVESNINKASDVWRRVWFHPSMMRLHTLVFFHRDQVFLGLFLIIGIFFLFFLARRRSTVGARQGVRKDTSSTL